MVRKKDKSIRMCIDYCGLNAFTIKNEYPLPKIDKLFAQILGAYYFTKIDFRMGCHQEGIKMQDISKMAFRTLFGHFEFLVMPFSLTTAPCFLMTLMDSVL